MDSVEQQAKLEHMRKIQWKKILKEAIIEWSDLLGIYLPRWCRRRLMGQGISNHTSDGVRQSSLRDVRVVVTQVAGNLDYIDEFVLNNELRQYRLAGFPIEEAPQDREKVFVRPLWAIEVFQNGRLARQITYYLQPEVLDKTTDDVASEEAPTPLRIA